MNFLDYIRNEMKNRGIDYFLYKDCDPHMSEYVNDHYKFRTVISGFTGSNGTLILGLKDAYLFTDGRYFIQAENELKGTGIKLMKLSTPGYPSLKGFITELKNEGNVFCCYGNNLSYKEYLDYGIELADEDNSVFLNAYEKCFSKPYPELNADDFVEELSVELCGEYRNSKIEKIRETMVSRNYDYYISSALDANMWIMNIRGRAIEHNPVAFSYIVITREECFLFIKRALDSLTEDGIKIYDYDLFSDFIRKIPNGKSVAFKFEQTPLTAAHILSDKNTDIFNDDCGVSLLKSIKNETEIRNIKEAYKKDNKIVSEFINWINSVDITSLNEFEAMNKLDEMRLSEEDCYDLSFSTISASGPNAAMMHYESKEDACSMILKDNLYLFDSGGQWKGGTTDITRTVAIGNPTYEMKHDYTRVARGMLSLMNAVFLEGCTGINLDILAREPMWEEGDDYKCGTGHGIGYMLSVHEGPHAIRWLSRPNGKDTVLKPGMLVSDEPGIYKEGKYGIRIENILLVREKCETSDGRFLCFECLTYVPMDEKLILRDEMNERELKWLDEYQKRCCESI
ncbi:MAG: aminopeptidase P family protein [Lachnospiraceae bacterium]|nr:aminopeptidase P family protein [Lachnospiraceae bacterium]